MTYHVIIYSYSLTHHQQQAIIMMVVISLCRSCAVVFFTSHLLNYKLPFHSVSYFLHVFCHEVSFDGGS